MLGMLLVMHEGAALALAAVYWLAGAGGTASRVAISPTIPFGLNRRTIVEVFSGGVAGIVIPFLGFAVFVNLGLPTEKLEALPSIVKASLVYLMNFSGSFAIGEFLARRAMRKDDGG